MRLLAFALAAGALGGCELLLDPGGGTNEFAPRIDRSFPEAGVLELESGTLLFSAEGEDDDSLDLTWTWTVDDTISTSSSSSDGTFDAEWELPWDPEQSGRSLTVRFEVTDGEFASELLWTVSVL